MCIAALRVNSVNDALQILRDYPELAKQLKGVDLALGGGATCRFPIRVLQQL